MKLQHYGHLNKTWVTTPVDTQLECVKSQKAPRLHKEPQVIDDGWKRIKSFPGLNNLTGYPVTSGQCIYMKKKYTYEQH